MMQHRHGTKFGTRPECQIMFLVLIVHVSVKVIFYPKKVNYHRLALEFNFITR